MKKLLSICFLSILLGFLNFSAKAQCGFWVENLQPDVLTGVANSGNTNGTYALNHTLGSASGYLDGQYNGYFGNVQPDALAHNGGAVQLYELHVCPCDAYSGKKVSFDWQLEHRNADGEWEIVNDNLSNYAEFGIYTFYPQINSYTGQCQSIAWLGGIVPDGYGYCTEADTYTLLDTIQGLPHCTTPTNYPGALQTQPVTTTGVPGTVLATLPTPSSPMVNIYSQGFDYFYYDFLASTRNIVTIHWKYPGEYRLVMRVRERIGGTDWYNAQWGGNEFAHIGGHQSCCGPVLMEDAIGYPVFDTLNMEICENADAVVLGGPAPETFAFHANIPDTTLLYGTFEGTPACPYIDINKIQNVSFFLRHNPVLEADDLTICKCDPFTVDSLKNLVHADLTGLTDNDSYQIWWLKNNNTWTTTPTLPAGMAPGTYEYTIKQINTYNDTLDCESEPVTITLTIDEIQAPTITVGNVDFCLETIDSTTELTAVAVFDETCATTARWYTKLNAADGAALYNYIKTNPAYRILGNIKASSLLPDQDEELSVNLIDYMPSVNKDTTLYFFATSYNEETNCESPVFAFFVVNLYQTPVLTATPMDSMWCPNGDVTMKVTTEYTPNTVNRYPYDYFWVNRDTVESMSKINTYTHRLGSLCGVDYVTNVFVIDSNGCKSAPVTFNYFTGDTTAPVITPADTIHFVEACEVTAENAPIYTTLEDVVEAFDLTIEDNCDVELVTLVGVTDSVVSTEYCNDSHKRTYTFRDACGNEATFTEFVTPLDEEAPAFTYDRPIRLLPVPAGNCTYDCPDSMTLIRAIAPYVYDNCTDSAYLMQTVKFTWENTDLSPFGENGKDIFRQENHLTINVNITDKCGNTTDSAAFFLDRPDPFVVLDGITAEDYICFGDTVTLTFDSTVCIDDSIVGPFNPYTYQWIADRDDVEFSAQNDIVTDVTFTGYGYFEFNMVVTNHNGCVDTAVSKLVYVRKNPVIAITPVPADVETPLCPTYGYLDIRADLVDPVEGQYLLPHSFIWTGESVNHASDADTSFIHIIPVYCDTLYTAYVYAVDDKGCPAVAEYSVRAKAQEPTLDINIPEFTMQPQEGCVLRVPNFKDSIIGAMVNDPCYDFNIGIKAHQEAGVDTLVENLIINGSTYDWYSQTPAAGTIVDGDALLIITITNPCGAVMKDTVQLLKPTDYITVGIINPEEEVCQDDLLDGGYVVFGAIASDEYATYSWTELDDDEVLSDVALLTIGDTLFDAGTDYKNYYYVVTATDANGCSASDTATLTVFYQGKDVHTTIWNDNMCTADNGIIRVDSVLTGYTVYLYGVDVICDKVNDVPYHEGTIWNSVYFDSLSTGWYLVTVVNLHGCDRSALVFVGEDGNNVTPAIVAVTPAQCNGQNGNIAVTEQTGYTYELYKQIPLTGAPTAAYGWQLQENYEGTVDAGVYFIRKISNTTFCYKDSTFTVDIEASEFDFTVTITPRTQCYSDYYGTTESYNGVIAFDNTNYKYLVKYSADSITWPANWDIKSNKNVANTQVSGLNYGYYAIAAEDEAGCVAYDTFKLNDAREIVDFTATITPNYSCTPTKNGSIEFAPATGYRYYHAFPTYTSHINDPEYFTNPYTGLASIDEGYFITAVSTDGNYCRATKNFFVPDSLYYPVVTVDSIISNTSCDPERLAYNGGIVFNVTAEGNNANIYNNYIKNYSIQIDEVVHNGGLIYFDSLKTDSDIASHVHTVGGLNENHYRWTVISKYGCAVEGDTVVTHKHIDPMELAMIPNHYCGPMGTTKPGNGQVIILSPIAEQGELDHFYEYKFYDSTYAEMEVPYDLPLTHTMYWMADGLYHVYAFDTVTGCEVEDSIYVELDVFEFELSITTTPSQFCDPENGDGTATVTIINAENPDGNYVFSMDGVNFNNTTGIFTGLAVGSYHFWAKDLTTGCIREAEARVIDSLCQPRFFITDGTDTNKNFTYCIYDADVTLTGWVETDCDTNFLYSWKAPCSNIDTSDNASILVDIDHVMPNGCTYIFHAYNPVTGCKYDTMINVSIHERPGFYFTINQEPAMTSISNLYCEQENLLIAVVPFPGIVLDSYEWTQGYNGTDSSFNFMGMDTNLNAITFCVRVTDTNNCKSNIGSLPVSFNRRVYLTAYDTACESIEIDDSTYTYQESGSNFVVLETRPSLDMAVTHACDTFITHYVTLYRQPVLEEDAFISFYDSTFCEPYDNIIADLLDTVNHYLVPTGDSCTVTLKVWNEEEEAYVNFVAPLTYEKSELLVVITPNNDYCDAIEFPIHLDLAKAPVIDSFALENPYCAGHTAEVTALVSTFADSTLVTMALPNGETLEHTIYGRHDSVRVNFEFTPYNATFDSLNVILTASSECGSVADTELIRVDTSIVKIQPITICEGQELVYALFPDINGYNNIVAFVGEGGNFSDIADSTVLTDSTYIYFTMTNRCGDVVKSDTVRVNVKPLPRIEDEPFDILDLCVADAVEALELLRPTVTYATVQGWKIMMDTILSDTLSTQVLVDSAKAKASVDVYYYASNDCGDSLVFMGTLRLLDTVKLTAPASVNLCPQEVNLGDFFNKISPSMSYDSSNYEADELDLHFYYRDGSDWIETYAATSGYLPENVDTVKVIFAPNDNVQSCGYDSAFVTVNIYDTTHTEPVMDTACVGNPFSDFVATQPAWNTNSNIIVHADSAYWTVYNYTDAKFVRFTNMDTVFVNEPNSPVQVQYVWVTLCGNYYTEIYDLKFYEQPTVEITSDLIVSGEQYDTLKVCLNTMLSDLDIEAVVTDNNNPSIVSDTTWYLNGTELDFAADHKFTKADSNKLLVVEITTECVPAYDTVVVIVNNLPVPKAQGDDIICTSGSATLSVVDPVDGYTYYWMFGEDTIAEGVQSVEVYFNDQLDGNEQISTLIRPYETIVPQSEFYTFTVVAKDQNGCVSTEMINTSNDAYAEDVISIKSTNDPQFIFKYQGNETHRIEGLTTGNLTNYTWEINNDCMRGDKLVFVEYTIYHNDTLIATESLGDYFQAQTFNTRDWITRNHISWLSSSPNSTPQFATGFYNSSIPGFEDAFSGAQTGNHFPNQDMAFGNAQQYDDVFMHFLSNRPVTKTIAPFITNGEYKIVYRLIATSYQSTYQHMYFNEDSTQNLKIGGHNAYSGTLDTLAIDSILLIVGGDNLAAVENPAAPSMAPVITTDESVIAPEMEVWPNPAPAIVTTFKARVYNMRGNATVTINNFSGKQVYNGEIFIDRDGYYFEADVNSLSVGAYIMTVRTQDAVVTKKLVVTVRQ